MMGVRRWLCLCPYRDCGPWECRARRAGIAIIDLPGLDAPRLLGKAGCPPIFFMALDCATPREMQIGWLCGELALWAYGDDSVQARLNGMVPPETLEETG